MQRRIIWIVAVGIIALLVGLPLVSQTSGGRVDAQAQQTAVVERTNLGTSIETTGTIAAAQTVQLSFGVSGFVSEVLVEVGTEVNAGDVLARLDTTELENTIARQEQALIVQQTSYDALVAEPTAREIAQAQANLASAQSQLEQAQINQATASNNVTINCANVESTQLDLERAQDAYDDYIYAGYEMDATFVPDPDSEAGERLADAERAHNVARAQCNETTPDAQYEAAVNAAQAAVDQAQAALDDLLSGPTEEEIASAQAQLEQARLNLENAQAALADAVITAPFTGVISAVSINPGQLVNTAASALTLIDNSQLHIDVSVDELDIAEVEVGQPAIIKPEALDGLEIEGVVTRIAPTSSNNDGIVTYEVRVDLTNITGMPVRIGMTTDVEIQVGEISDALVVPTEAIQRDGQTEFVEVLNADNTTARVTVTTGATIDGMTVVVGDLSEGVVVIIPLREATGSGNGLPFGGGN
ncbi:MAG: efflux RND transporter periplasmic adaptor subunit [Chloroflexota bacterium]|nr:efflux RND transporter periplasmic adaptor subunit [Chloroflexota bacterium]